MIWGEEKVQRIKKGRMNNIIWHNHGENLQGSVEMKREMHMACKNKADLNKK